MNTHDLAHDRLVIQQVIPPTWVSPLVERPGYRFVDDHTRIRYSQETTSAEDLGFEPSGPRHKIFLDAATARAGIVTCGGLCPGINDVIRAVVLALWHNYGVRRVYGFQHGYQGLVPSYGHEVLSLDPNTVDGWQDLGGTKLGSSRGEQDPAVMVDTLQRLGVNVFFVIGGDGTMRGANVIVEEIRRRGLKIVVIGIPKTIDNDIPFIDESFGFQSACEAAVEILRCAHVEAKGAPNGVGLVQLMGRHSGFIACHASLAMNDVNFVLIPEVPFELDGPRGFLAALERRLHARRHAVIVVAEGAGQQFIQGDAKLDQSGNVVLKDIGAFLEARIKAYAAERKFVCNVRYIDPSYAIRSVPANAYDSVYCLELGYDAVHAAMAGRTAMLVGRRHGRVVHMPLELVVSGKKQVDTEGSLYQMVLGTTDLRYWSSEWQQS